MKILLTYLVIGMIVSIVRCIAVSVMTKGKIWSSFKSPDSFRKFILSEIIIGALIWPIVTYAIIRSLIMIALERYDQVDDIVEASKKAYFN